MEKHRITRNLFSNKELRHKILDICLKTYENENPWVNERHGLSVTSNMQSIYYLPLNV